MAFPIVPILTAAFNFFAEPIRRKQELTRVQHEADIQRIQSGDDHAAELDSLSIAQRGWKDEYLLILSTVPLVGIFIDPFFGDGSISAGMSQAFGVLETMPEYYWWVLGIIYIDTFGFRRMLRVAVEMWLKNKFGKI